MNNEPSLLAITAIKTHITGVHNAISQMPQSEQTGLRACTDDLWAQLKRVEDTLVVTVRARRHAA